MPSQSIQTEGLAHQAMKWITQLYALEKKLKDENALPELIKAICHEKANPIIEEMHGWLQLQRGICLSGNLKQTIIFLNSVLIKVHYFKHK